MVPRAKPTTYHFPWEIDANQPSLRGSDLTAGELAEHFDMSKPSLSHHLATLESAGLVRDERHGQNIVYSLNTTVMQDLIGWFMGFADNEDNGDE